MLPATINEKDNTCTTSTVGIARAPRSSPYVLTPPRSNASTMSPVRSANRTPRIVIETAVYTRNAGPTPTRLAPVPRSK